MTKADKELYEALEQEEPWSPTVFLELRDMWLAPYWSKVGYPVVSCLGNGEALYESVERELLRQWPWQLIGQGMVPIEDDDPEFDVANGVWPDDA